jgi:hypothetical protein
MLPVLQGKFAGIGRELALASIKKIMLGWDTVSN